MTILIDEFNSLQTKEERTNFFSQIKGSFNDIWANKNNDYFENENEALLSAVLMYVLNKTCFNGLFRVNKKVSLTYHLVATLQLLYLALKISKDIVRL